MQASAPLPYQPGPTGQSCLKYRQVMDHVTNEIRRGGIRASGRLPSINETSEELNMARDTVERAYKELIQKGLIYSVPSKGYFIHPDCSKKIRPWVHMVLDSLSNSRERFVQGFLDEANNRLGLGITVYQENLRLMQTAVRNGNNASKYLVVLPNHFSSPEWVRSTLAEVAGDRLVVVESHSAQGPGGHGSVTGDFFSATLGCLREAGDRFNAYKRLIAVKPDDFTYPNDIIRALEIAALELGLNFETAYPDEKLPLQVGDLLFVMQEPDLLHLVREIERKGWAPGKEVGIFSYQNEAYQEVLGGGITTLTLDYEDMGRQTARMIIDGYMTSASIHMNWVFRNSF